MINHILGRNHLSGEVASIEATNRILAALLAVEFDVEFAVVVVEPDADVDDVAVLLFAFAADVVFEFLLPVWICLAVSRSVL